MPQLRDSGTRSLHATEPVPSAEMERGFCRIFGVETEYGVAVTGAERPVDAGQVAMTMFQPIVSRSRSTNTYLANGSRLYLDVGSHPENATAEARDPREALAQDLAGEHVMRNLALKAQRKLRESYGAHATIHVFKNNVDSAGHAFGCHENYLVRRFVPLETIEHQLLPFLITRQPVHRCRPHDPGRLPDHPARGLPGRGRLLGHHPLPPDGQHARRTARQPDSSAGCM